MKAFYRAAIYGFSRLPFPILYFLSDILFVVFYYILKYRQAVVWENLKNSFPQKTEAELKKIKRQFYKHLADITLETLKALTISQAELQKRCKIADSKSFKKYITEENGAVVLTAHTGNWEWGGLAFGLATVNKPVQVVYLKIKNDMFNEIMKHLRTRFGNHAVHMENVFRESLKNRKLVSCFLADQTPQRHQIGYWANFLNRPTPFFSGPEKMAQKLNQSVYFVNIRRVKRGFYELDVEVVNENPTQAKPNEIMAAYTNILEKAILKQPFNWLWSHRRWKHKFES